MLTKGGGANTGLEARTHETVSGISLNLFQLHVEFIY